MPKPDTCRIVLDLVADYRSAEWVESAVLQDRAQARSYAGREAISEFLHSLYEDGFGGARRDVTRVIADRNGAAVEYTLRGRHCGPFAGIRPTGREIALPMVMVCEIRGGLILLADLYYDTGILLRQLGMAL